VLTEERPPLPRTPRTGLTDVAQPVAAGVVTAVVGFAGSFTLVLDGLGAVGATRRQAESGLLVLCLAMCLLSLWFGLRLRQPVSIAWSTPGAALMATVGHQTGGFPAAVGAFVVAGVLVAVTAAWGRLGRALAAVPAPVSMALFAGILLPLCLAPARGAVDCPELALPTILSWALLMRYARRWAVPGALVVAVAGVLLREHGQLSLPAGGLAPRLDLTAPHFSLGAVIGLAVPLYVITMAAQNLPGLTLLSHFGYRPPTRAVLLTTGLGTAAVACASGFMLNLAASTAALVAGPDAHRDPGRRWVASVTAALAYCGFGLAVGVFATLLAVAPPLIFQTVAGLALLGVFGQALNTAFGRAEAVPAAAVTFAVTASSVSVLGVGAAFWGLLAGLAAHRLLPGGAPAAAAEDVRPTAPGSAAPGPVTRGPAPSVHRPAAGPGARRRGRPQG